MLSRRPRTRVYLAIAATIVLAFVLPPSVNLKHFRGILSQSLSRSLGRQASVQDVRLRLLPLPGFAFRRLEISDDEEFGAEPILQTKEDDGQYSVATLRLTSLWRGRLEIASISLTGASMNLVRAADGHWNLERLIDRAAQVPSAPTSKKRAEVRSRFPYIELKDSRINFKFGAEKKPVSLSDAEFALWLAAENRWNVRLKAVPLRTDESISDTGTIRLSGSFDRASQFSQTPFHFEANWERPEFDAIPRIVRGHDPGWRGAVELAAELKGTPADFAAHLTANIDEFRRYDIARNSSFDVRVSCDQRFRNDGILTDESSELSFQCKLPLDNGLVNADGFMHLARSPDFRLRIFASKVPVAALTAAMLHAKSTLPADLTGDGFVDGDWSIERAGTGPVTWNGTLTASNTVLRSDVLGEPLMFPDSVSINFDTLQLSAKPKLGRPAISQPSIPRAVIEPFTLDLGGDTRISASFDKSGYRVDVNGSADWQRLMRAARTIGLNPPRSDLRGSGLIDAHYSGEWQHFSPPTVTGTAQIRSATLSVRGFSEPLRVSGGTLSFDGPSFNAENLTGKFVHSGLAFSGNLSGTRECRQHIVCELTFSLETNDLREEALLNLLAPQSGLPIPFLDSRRNFQAKWLLDVPASGTLLAQRIELRGLQAKNVSAQLQIQSGKVQVHHWTADLYGGKHTGDWTFDFTGSVPSIAAAGTIQRARMDLFGAGMNHDTGTGTLNLAYRMTMRGSNVVQLAASAIGDGTFSWQNGAIASSASHAPERIPTHFALWSGSFALAKQRISLRNTRMKSITGLQEVSGEIPFSKPWELTFSNAATGDVAANRSLGASVISKQSGSLTEARR